MPDSTALRHKVAIVGASETEQLGRIPDMSAVQLNADAAFRARDDAGLTLDDSQLAFLYQAAPDAFAMADRPRQPITWSDEPANTFRFATTRKAAERSI